MVVIQQKPQGATNVRQCDICHREANDFRAVVSNGQFYKSVCDLCRGGATLTPMDAKFTKARDVEDYAEDLLQPYVEGKPNKDFFIKYPDLMDDMLTPEERAEI